MRGNTLDLFEPSYSRLFYPEILDNSRFPDAWLKDLSACENELQMHNYANDLLQRILKDVSQSSNFANSLNQGVAR